MLPLRKIFKIKLTYFKPIILLVMLCSMASSKTLALRPFLNQPIVGLDTIESEIPFGMRAREKPTNINMVKAPVVITKAPTNESTLIKLQSGLIKIFYINRPGKADKMMSITSTDLGWTWKTPEVEFDLPGEAYYANQVMQDKDGTIHCIYHIFKPGNLGYRGRHLDLWYTNKKPGEKWTAPNMIFNGYVGSIRGFIQLKNGRLVIPMSESDTSRANKPTHGDTDYGLFQVITLNSDDAGMSWVKSSSTLKIPIDKNQVTRYGAVEPNAIELNDGRIWMLIRTNKGFLYETYSHDSGTSWEEPKQSDFISSDSPASTLRLKNGKIILFLNQDQRYDDNRSYANGGREALHAAFSTDEAASWKGFREVLVSPASKPVKRGDRGTAYPSAVELDNGKILVVSGQGEEASVFMFDQHWLEEKSQKDNFKNGLIQWTNHGSVNNGVWNFPMTMKGKLYIKLKNHSNSNLVELALTDHFSVAHDSVASKISPFYFSPKLLKITKAKTIKIEWDMSQLNSALKINGENIPSTEFHFSPTKYGFNYLRIKTESDKIYEAIEHLKMRPLHY